MSNTQLAFSFIGLRIISLIISLNFRFDVQMWGPLEFIRIDNIAHIIASFMKWVP